MSRISKTEENYKLIAKRLIGKYNREVSESPHTMKFLDWIVLQKKKWRPSTWRQNKAAMMYAFEFANQVSLMEKLRNIGSGGCAKRLSGGDVKNTSSKKRKSITDAEFVELVKVLENKKGAWAINTILYMTAGLLVGLRPSEWESAELIGEVLPQDGFKTDLVLRVKNGKHSNGRSHGEYRNLILNDFRECEIMTIRIHLSKIRQWIRAGREFSEYYEACRRCLYGARYELKRYQKGKNITLYSMRHQFSANLKNAGYSLQEIATLMGHAVDDTATEHYGKKRSGRSGRLPKAHPDEVGRVKIKYGVPKASSPKL